MDIRIHASQICCLTLEEVHEGYLTVFDEDAKEQEVGISPTTARALQKYIHMYRPWLVLSEHERHVFLGYGGGLLLRNGLHQALQRIDQCANIEGIRLRPHNFRHTVARGWLENDGEIFKLSRVLGQRETQTTQIYLRDFQSRKARADHTNSRRSSAISWAGYSGAMADILTPDCNHEIVSLR